MNVTLDNTIVLTERLLQLSTVRRKEQGIASLRRWTG